MADIEPRGSFRLAGWVVDPVSGEMHRDGRAERVEPKVMDVLALLARNSGEVVTKEALLEEVWNGAYVTDDVLWRSISSLRRILDADSDADSAIETLPRRGYRLLPEVVWLGDAAAASGHPPTPWKLSARRDDAGNGSDAMSKLQIGASILLISLVVSTTTIGLMASLRRSSVSPSSTARPPEPVDPSSEMLSQAWDYYRSGDLGNLERAIELFGRQVDHEPESPEGYLGLAHCYGRLVFRHRLEEPWAGRSLQAALRATELAPVSGRAYRALGVARMANAQPKEAITAFHRAIELRPADADLMQNLGEIYRILGELERTLHWYGRYFERGRPNAYHFAALSDALRRLGYENLARAYLEQALFKEPFHPMATLQLVRLEVQAGDFERADHLVREIARVEPDDVQVAVAAADVAWRSGDLDGARVHLERVGASDAENGDLGATSLLAFLSPPLEPSVSATLEARSRRLLGERPGHWKNWLIRARVATLEGKEEDALQAIDQAMGLGYLDSEDLRLDPVLSTLSGHQRFTEMVDEMAAHQEVLRQRVEAAGTLSSLPVPGGRRHVAGIRISPGIPAPAAHHADRPPERP